MPHQLIFTSVPEGLQPGSRGFTTVACSAALLPPMISKLESMSVYKPAFGLGDPNARMNPVLYAYRRIQQGNDWVPVLTRSAPAGTDYSGRSNTFTHHVLPDATEIAPAGPAWLCQQAHLFHSVWDGQPRHINDQELEIPLIDTPAAPCTAWEALSGDAGWGGALTAAHFNAPNTPVYLLYRPGTDVLSLIAESVALLPPEERWKATFNTYWTSARQDIACRWRCVMAGGPGQQAIPRNAEIVDLTQPLRRPLPGPATDAARAGLIWDKQTGLRPRPAAPPPLANGTRPPVKTDDGVAFDLSLDDSSPQAASVNQQTGGRVDRPMPTVPPPLTRQHNQASTNLWRGPWPWVTLASMGLALGAVVFALVSSRSPQQTAVAQATSLDPVDDTETTTLEPRQPDAKTTGVIPDLTEEDPPSTPAQVEADAQPSDSKPITTSVVSEVSSSPAPVDPPTAQATTSTQEPEPEAAPTPPSSERIEAPVKLADADIEDVENGDPSGSSLTTSASPTTPIPSLQRVALTGTPKTNWISLPKQGFAEQSLFQFGSQQQNQIDLGPTGGLRFAYFLPADELLTYRLLDGGQTLAILAKDLPRIDRHLGDFRFEQGASDQRVRAVYTPGNPDAAARLAGLRIGLMDQTDRLLLLAVTPPASAATGDVEPLIVGPIKPIVPVTETQAHQTARLVFQENQPKPEMDAQGRLRFGDGGYVELAKRRQVTQKPTDPNTAWFLRSELSELQQLRKSATAQAFNDLLAEYQQTVAAIQAVEIIDSFQQVVRRYPVAFDTARDFRLKIDPRRQKQIDENQRSRSNDLWNLNP